MYLQLVMRIFGIELSNFCKVKAKAIDLSGTLHHLNYKYYYSGGTKILLHVSDGFSKLELGLVRVRIRVRVGVVFTIQCIFEKLSTKEVWK